MDKTYSKDDMRIFGADKLKAVWQSKVFQKYKAAFAVIAFGFFLGGPVAMGVLGGVLSGLGTKAAMERLKEGKPSVYNWVLDHPGWVEIISMVACAGIFGLTLGGIFISLVANFTTSATLDYIAENEGKLANVPALSLRGIIRGLIDFIKNVFVSLRPETNNDSIQVSAIPLIVDAELVQQAA